MFATATAHSGHQQRTGTRKPQNRQAATTNKETQQTQQKSSPTGASAEPVPFALELVNGSAQARAVQVQKVVV